MSPFDQLGDMCVFDKLDNLAEGLENQLTAVGRLNLLAVAIRVAPLNAACELMDAALQDLSAGQPIPAFGSYAQAAQDWASFATTAERKSYLVTIYNSLSEKDQAAFWQFVQVRAAA